MSPRLTVIRLIFLRASVVILLILGGAGAALANCSALPVLSGIVYDVEDLKTLQDTASVARVGHRINEKRQKISKFGMFEALKPLGYERKLDDILRLKVKLGALSQIAITQGPEKLKPFMNGSGFQRTYMVAKALTDEFCSARDAADQSDFASKVFSVWDGGASLRQTGFAGPLVAVSLLIGSIGALVGLYIGAKLHKMKARQEARRTKRFPCNIPVLLGAVDNVDTQIVVDLSLTGANIENSLGLPPGTSVNILFGTVSRVATVTWSNEKFAGVQFNAALTPEEMRATLELSTPIQEPQKEKHDAIQGVAQI